MVRPTGQEIGAIKKTVPKRRGVRQASGYTEAPGTVKRSKGKGKSGPEPLLWLLGRRQERHGKQVSDWLVCIISIGSGVRVAQSVRVCKEKKKKKSL